MNGEDIDSESGCEHVGHMMANLMFLSYVMREKREQFDDRYNVQHLYKTTER